MVLSRANSTPSQRADRSTSAALPIAHLTRKNAQTRVTSDALRPRGGTATRTGRDTCRARVPACLYVRARRALHDELDDSGESPKRSLHISAEPRENLGDGPIHVRLAGELR